MIPELEIMFARRGVTTYTVALRYRGENDAVENRKEARVRLDAEAFAADDLLADPPKYGLALGAALVSAPAVREMFQRLTDTAGGSPFRLRLGMDQRSLKLHRLRWELLRVPDPAAPDDPKKAKWLAADKNVYFSRHLFSGDMRSVRLRPRSALSAAIVVASPTDIATYEDGAGRRLTPMDLTSPDGELAVAKHGLIGLAMPDPVTPADGNRVTLARLLATLGAEPDILYLVCHGAMKDGEPHLLLEEPDGTAAVVSGDDLIAAFRPLRTLPRLVVMISCQSGGDTTARAGDPGSDRAVLSSLGPKLAEAGVAAVLAMQGDLDRATAKEFLPPFFGVLNDTGRVDEAVAAGRAAAALKNRPDAWVPVLYTRLVEGRVWFTKGLTALNGQTDVSWTQLILDIHRGKCVPILGAGVLEPMLGGTREVARELAEKNGYPFAVGGRDDLPQVAQFLETMRTPAAPQVQVPVLAEMAETVGRRYSRAAAAHAAGPDPGAVLRDRLAVAWGEYRVGRPFEPHQYLAGMTTIKTLVTTNPDDLLERALAAAGRPAKVHRWGGAADDAPDPAGLVGGGPQVFHLMGRLDDLDSVVLTEDDYFEFLTANARRATQTKNEALSGDMADILLQGALASSALVFLGFRITDWDFRTVCRLLADQTGKGGRRKRTHIAVQVDPEDGTHEDAIQARNYIAKLCNRWIAEPSQSQVAVYWGTAEDFLEELDREWKRLQGPAPGAG